MKRLDVPLRKGTCERVRSGEVLCEGQCGGCLTSLSEKLWVAGDVKLEVVRTCAVRMNGSVCVLDVRTEPELLMISTLE